MDLKEHTHPDRLERYSFLWSEVRLVVAAVALFLGGIPVLYFVFRSPGMFEVVRGVLMITWIISGLASAYLLYRWIRNGQRLFGGKAPLDMVAFLVSVISGINLGLVGLTGRNIGMSILANRPIFVIVGLIYLASAWHLYRRWKASGERLFS